MDADIFSIIPQFSNKNNSKKSNPESTVFKSSKHPLQSSATPGTSFNSHPSMISIEEKKESKKKWWLLSDSSCRRPSIQIPDHHPGDNPPHLLSLTSPKDDSHSQTLKIISSASKVCINNSKRNTGILGIFSRIKSSIMCKFEDK